MITGVYKYLYLVELYPVKTFGQGTTRVEVLEETPAKYRVKFIDFHVDGRGPGTITWVRRDKVKLDESPAPPDVTPPDWLPYKDE